MARINIEKAIEKGHQIMNTRYSMSFDAVLEIAAKGRCTAVNDAFALGYYQGVKAAKAEMKKAKI